MIIVCVGFVLGCRSREILRDFSDPSHNCVVTGQLVTRDPNFLGSPFSITNISSLALAKTDDSAIVGDYTLITLAFCC